MIDLSSGSYTLPNRQSYPIKPEAASDARQYAAYSNAYLDHEERTGALHTVIDTNRTKAPSGTSVAKAASAITEVEGDRSRHAYGDQGKYVGHVPDSSVSGVPSSPMGFMPIDPDANTLVGYGSGIGRRTGKPIRGMVVRESTGRVHRYRPKSAAAAADASSTASFPGSTTSTSSTSTSSAPRAVPSHHAHHPPLPSPMPAAATAPTPSVDPGEDPELDAILAHIPAESFSENRSTAPAAASTAASSSSSSSSVPSRSSVALNLASNSALPTLPDAGRWPIHVLHDPSWSGLSDEEVEHPRGS